MTEKSQRANHVHRRPPNAQPCRGASALNNRAQDDFNLREGPHPPSVFSLAISLHEVQQHPGSLLRYCVWSASPLLFTSHPTMADQHFETDNEEEEDFDEMVRFPASFMPDANLDRTSNPRGMPFSSRSTSARQCLPFLRPRILRRRIKTAALFLLSNVHTRLCSRELYRTLKT